jgi:hypothetical protein
MATNHCPSGNPHLAPKRSEGVAVEVPVYKHVAPPERDPISCAFET